MEKILTVYEMFERSREFVEKSNPKKKAIIFVKKSWELGRDHDIESFDYNSLDYNVTFLARALAASGVVQKDRVVLCLPNSPSLVALYLAVSKLGATSVMLNPILPAERIADMVKEVRSKLVVSEKTIAGISSNAHSQTAYLHGGIAAKAVPDRTSVILFSSGTTGEQKAVELTQNNLFHNIRYTSAFTGLTPNDRSLCVIPLSHCFGLNFILGACFYTGATLILHENFDPVQLLHSLAYNKVSMFFAPPAIYNKYLKEKAEQYYFSSVRYFFYAADTLSLENINAWEREYGRTIYTGWGLTETTPFATSNHSAIYKRSNLYSRVPSVGKSIPGVEIKIIDKNGLEIRPIPDQSLDMDGKREEYYGEVCVKGHNVMKGYFNRPGDATIDSDGWLHTGDIGYLDHERYLFIEDRIKDIIIVGGYKALPSHIESALCQHPDVVEAGAIGIPHDEMNEIPKGFVVLKKGSRATPQEIMDFANPMLPSYERVRIIEFVEKIPRNPSGKILRRELRKIQKI